eukprot:3876383-Rhodomonas_salina.1
MAPRRNTVNPAGATSNATTEGQVAMDTPNVPPGIAQVAMDNSATPNPTADPTPPICPPLGQNEMAALNVVPVIQNVIPPVGQNAMAVPMIGIPPVHQNAMACQNGATQWTSQEAAWMGVPSLCSAPAAMMNCSNANGKKAVNYPGALKINMKPVCEAKPKGSHHNISLPAKLTCSYLQAEKVNVSEGEKKPIWAVHIQVANSYPLMSNMTYPPYPFEPFRFDCQKQLWYLQVLFKSEKMFYSVASWLEKKAIDHWMKFIQYKDIMAQTEIYLIYLREDVEWLNLSGEIWYLCNIAKDFCGRWSPATKQWVSISTEALPKLLQAIYDYWYPLTGNFNFNGCASTFIGSHGGYVEETATSGSCIRASCITMSEPKCKGLQMQFTSVRV